MKTILFASNTEHGQLNTILAIVQELVKRPHDVSSIHIVSFSTAGSRVQEMAAQSSVPISFHPLFGPTYVDGIARNGLLADLVHLPTSKSLKIFQDFGKLAMIWTEEEYLDQVNTLKQYITDIDPDAIVIDFLLSSAYDACRGLNRRYVVNSPMQALDITRLYQPGLTWLWHYPAIASGFSYPLSWPNFFKTIWINMNFLYLALTDPEAAKYNAFRRLNGFTWPSQWQETCRAEVTYICPSVEETDLPLVCPENLKRVGPIILDDSPVNAMKEVDGELFEWLNQAPTIYVNLGTHFEYKEQDIRGLVCGLLGGTSPETQILWKLPDHQHWTSLLNELFAQYPDGVSRRHSFRISHWIAASPSLLCRHPNVLCSVHHGGANSFFEACYAGVPQIILAKWLDLYENAVKAEFRGFGLYGNRHAAPDIEASEFGDALVRILGTTSFKQKAVEISARCRAAGGRALAAQIILDSASLGKVLSGT